MDLCQSYCFKAMRRSFIPKYFSACPNTPGFMKILLVSATLKEIDGVLETLESPECLEKNFFRGFAGNKLIDIQVTGVGAAATAEALSCRLKTSRYDLVVDAGICGSFKPEITTGAVVCIDSEVWGDLGAEDHDNFHDLFDLGILTPGQYPFTGKEIVNPGNAYSAFFAHLPEVKGLTVNKVHGESESILQCILKYNPDVESMEGAAFFSICISHGINFQSLRSISNFVEPRNRNSWETEKALLNLAKELNSIICDIRK